MKTLERYENGHYPGCYRFECEIARCGIGYDMGKWCMHGREGDLCKMCYPWHQVALPGDDE